MTILMVLELPRPSHHWTESGVLDCRGAKRFELVRRGESRLRLLLRSKNQKIQN